MKLKNINYVTWIYVLDQFNNDIAKMYANGQDVFNGLKAKGYNIKTKIMLNSIIFKIY